VLKRIFVSKSRKVKEAGEYYIMRSFKICVILQILLGWTNQMSRIRTDGTSFMLRGKLEGRDNLENASVDEIIILQYILNS
jgi:hypothetical protein